MLGDIVQIKMLLANVSNNMKAILNENELLRKEIEKILKENESLKKELEKK